MADISKVRMLNGTEYNYKDAKARSDIEGLKADLDNLEPGLLSDAAKAALLACFRNVAWDNGNGQIYYNTLEAALRGDTYPQIRATYTPGSHIVYTDDALSTLKQYLTVKVFENASDTGTAISSDDYTLSGALSEGNNSILVEYDGMVTGISVPAIDFYNIYTWNSGNTKTINGVSGTYGNTCGYNTATSANRRAIFTNRGKLGTYDNVNSRMDETTFPIPVPRLATSVKITISNINTAGFGMLEFTYLPESSKYRTDKTGAWTDGGTTVTLKQPQGDNRFISLHIRKDSNNSNFTTDPIVIIEFS